ncbi:hypothetical protein C9374_010116 [Naegleria lovaniensis]|uniref:Uncharacterized protein n=1 Tax=Naegleria lovaniensis TaxID=51637 RepID=A0AA88KJQ1_NAELO|nr:uncharacterized protein C9374_010116 [Naegleria lovaniensis]KAG2375112.1 hypothetical protein C9374_010116 [Naegleria lovaniensis]
MKASLRTIKRLEAKAQKFSSHILFHKRHHGKQYDASTDSIENFTGGSFKHTPNISSSIEGGSNLNAESIEDVSLNLCDPDIDRDDQKERENSCQLLKDALYYSLLTMYLPIHVVPEEYRSGVLTGNSEKGKNVPMSLAQLQDHVLKLFQNDLSKEDVEKTWNQLYTIDAENGTSDLCVDFLLLRKILLSKEQQLPYSQQDFKTPQNYATWRQNKIKEIDLILDSIKSGRKYKFASKLEFQIDHVSLEKKGALAKVHESAEILYRVNTAHSSEIKVNNEEKAINTFESPHMEAKLGDNGTFDLHFKDTIKVSFNESNQELTLHFVYAKFAGLKKKEIGSVKIKVNDLISKLFPMTNWGALNSPISLDFTIENPEHATESLGKISLKFLRGNYQNFPAFHGNWETYLREKTKKIEANLQSYKFPDIYEVKRVLLRRAFLAPKLDNSLVTPVHKWLLEEIDLLFGLSNHNAEISLLDVFSRNVRFLVTFADQFGKSYDTATNLVETNLKQIEKINKIMENTEKKVLDIILNFKDKFPRGKPEGALQNVLTIYDTILCRHKKRSYEEYITTLNELVDQALTLDYETFKKQQMEAFKTEEFNAKVLISMIPIVTFKLDRLYDFSSIFPEEIKYEQKNWIYYELFKKDFADLESKNGFTGYQMLHFCAKLKPLEEIVSCSTDLCAKKSELLDVHVISKGYEEKFISELYEKLSNCAQQSILVDNWLPVNEEVKHSTSVVDFYSTAHETWLFVSELEFFNEHLLELFTTMLGKVTFEYANKVKNLAVSVLTKNTKQSLVTNECEKSSNKLQLFKKKTSDSDSTDHVDEPYSEITITKDFLIMLNDIEVSKQELQDILQSVTEKQQAMKDSEEIEKKMEEQEKESQHDEAVSQSKETPNDDEVTDFENDTSLEKSLEKYHEVGEAQMTELEKLKNSLDILIESLLAIIASNFRIPIRKALEKIMNNARKVMDQQKGVTRPLSKQATLDLLQKDSDKILSEDIIDPILTPAFELLSENCYDQLFKLLIEKVLDIVNFEMLYTFVIPIENYDIELDKDKFLTVEQVYLMESCHVAIGLYFCGNDDDPNTGISEDTLEKNSRLLKRIFSLYESSSSKLINIYEKYVKYPNLNFTNTLKKHHILLILKTKHDPEAINFYKQHQREAEKERIIQVFNLKPIEGASDDDESNDRYEEILVSLNGIYEMTPYDIHVTELRLLLEAKYSRKTREFLLKDIRNAKLNKGLLSTKGIQFTIASEDNSVTRYITFSDSNVRTKFINVIAQQLKNIGNEQQQLMEELKSPTTASASTVSGSKKVEPSIFDQASDALKSKFKIKNTNCQLLRRIVCQSAYKEGETKTYLSGEVLLFNYCVCFHCFSDGVKATFSFKANFSIVKNIQLLKRKDNSSDKIKIELVGGYSVSFYNVDDAQMAIKDLSEAFEQWKNISSIDATQLEKYKKNDDKNYFLHRFHLKHLESSEETLDRKILSASAITEIGSLFIGHYHLCYESAHYLPTVTASSHEYEIICLPIAFIDKVEKYVHSKLVVLTLTSGQLCCFMFKEEKLLELAVQRIQAMIQSLRKQSSSSSSSGSGFFSKVSSSSSMTLSSNNNNSNNGMDQPMESNNLYRSPLMKPMKIDPDSTDQRVLNNAILTQKVQEASLQSSSLLGNSSDSGSGKTGIFGMFTSIGKNIFGSKKKK